MGIEDWSDLFTQTITHAEFAGRGEYGAPAYGSAVSYDARIVDKQKLVKKSDGSEALSTSSVWIQGNPTITTEDEITLPDGRTPPILLVEHFPDDDGDHHTKAYLG